MSARRLFGVSVFALLAVVAASSGQSLEGFVSSTHYLATDAGLEMLRQGGNAADATGHYNLIARVSLNRNYTS
jgi:hypothetical protein